MLNDIMLIKNKRFSVVLLACWLGLAMFAYPVFSQDEPPKTQEPAETTSEAPQPLSLREAIEANDVEAIKEAIAAGADVSAPLEDGSYPVMHAAKHGNAEVMELLSAYDVRFSVTDEKDRNPLHYLAERGSIESAKLILILDNRLLDVPDVDGITPLYAAYLSGHNQMAQFLIREGANIHRQDAQETPLAHRLVQAVDNPGAMAHLVKYRYNLFQRHDGQNLAEAAEQAGHMQSAAYLRAEMDRMMKAFQQE